MRQPRSCTTSILDVSTSGAGSGGLNNEPPAKRKKLTSLLSSIENDVNLSTASDLLTARSSNLRNRGLLKPNPKYSEEDRIEDDETPKPKKRGRKPGKVYPKYAKRANSIGKPTPLMVESPGEPARFGCDVCGKTYSAKNGFERHMERHLGKNRFGCSYCSHTSLRKDNLKTHHTAKHKGLEFNPIYPVGADYQVESSSNDANNESSATLATALSEQLDNISVTNTTFNLPPGFADIVANTVEPEANEHTEEENEPSELIETNDDDTLVAEEQVIYDETIPMFNNDPVIIAETSPEQSVSENATPITTVEERACPPAPTRTRAPSESYDEVPPEEPTLMMNIKAESIDISAPHNTAYSSTPVEQPAVAPVPKMRPMPPPRIVKREMIMPPTPVAVPIAPTPVNIKPVLPFLRNVKHEVIELDDDTPQRLIVDETETIQYVIRENASNEPNKLFIVWDEEFTQDVAYSVVKQSSNCILALRKCSYTSFGKFCSSFVKGSVECPQIRMEAEKDRSLHLLAFGNRTQRMIREESSYRTHSQLERDLIAISERGDITHIVRYSEDPNSWSHQLVKQLNGPLIRTNKYFN